jgi:DNA-binding SARP family transcriptional activator
MEEEKDLLAQCIEEINELSEAEITARLKLVAYLNMIFSKKRDNDEMLAMIMQATADFFGAEWVGIVDVDLETRMMEPYFWYRKGVGSMGFTAFEEQEYSDEMFRWVRALRAGETVKVIDVDEIKVKAPWEYALYRKLGVHSLIAVPFYKKPAGFLVVKNPTENLNSPIVLKILARQCIKEVCEKKCQECRKYAAPPNFITKENDVMFRLFGGIKIYTFYGCVPSAEMDGTLIAQIILLLTLKKKAISAMGLAEMTDPEKTAAATGQNIRQCIHRFYKKYGTLFGEEHLITSGERGYQLNPELNIITDLDKFEEYCRDAADAESGDQKIMSLRKAFDLYHGDLKCSGAGTDGIEFSAMQSYHSAYLKIFRDLCKLLNEKQDYDTVHYLAFKAIKRGQEDPVVYYWLIRSLYAKHQTATCLKTIRLAKERMDRVGYSIMIARLQQDINIRLEKSYADLVENAG